MSDLWILLLSIIVIVDLSSRDVLRHIYYNTCIPCHVWFQRKYLVFKLKYTHDGAAHYKLYKIFDWRSSSSHTSTQKKTSFLRVYNTLEQSQHWNEFFSFDQNKNPRSSNPICLRLESQIILTVLYTRNYLHLNPIIYTYILYII